MAQGRRSRLMIHLTFPQYQALTAASTSPQTRAPYRARLVLLRAEGMPITRIAQQVGLSRLHVYKWLRRFVTDGMAGLENRVRPHRGSRWA